MLRKDPRIVWEGKVENDRNSYRFRVVLNSDGEQACIERSSGVDAMGQERWQYWEIDDGDSIVFRSILAELAKRIPQ